MDQDRRRILDLLADGKINADEAPDRGERVHPRDQAGDQDQRREHEAQHHQQQPDQKERQPEADAAPGVGMHLDDGDEWDHRPCSSSRMAAWTSISPALSRSSTSRLGGAGSVSTKARLAAMRFSLALMVG